MSNLLDKLTAAGARLNRIEDLSRLLAMPVEFSDLVRGKRLPIQYHFRRALFPIPADFDTGRDSITITRLAKALIDPACENAWLQKYYDFLPRDPESGVYSKPDPSDYDPSLVHRTLLRIMYYDYACLHNFRIPYKRLMAEIGHGRQSALFQMVQVDKTFVVGPYGSSLIIKKQHEGDWEFFRKLGQAVMKPPVDEPEYLFKAKLLCAHFWQGELSEMSYARIVGVLEEAEVLAPGIVDPRALAKTLNRQGLKKTRHTRN